ncbi:MAG: hypothetical protein AB1489_31420 [Acidobacteriota bacterium]
MRLSGEPCPICGRAITPLDSMRNITFHDRPEKLHHRCWYENQDLIALLEQGDTQLPLVQALQKSRKANS